MPLLTSMLPIHAPFQAVEYAEDAGSMWIKRTGSTRPCPLRRLPDQCRERFRRIFLLPGVARIMERAEIRERQVAERPAGGSSTPWCPSTMCPSSCRMICSWWDGDVQLSRVDQILVVRLEPHPRQATPEWEAVADR